MKDKANLLIAMLVMFIAGAAAMWVIVQVATQRTVAPVTGGTEASYSQLQQSILKQ